MAEQTPFRARVRVVGRGMTRAEVLTCKDCTSEYEFAEVSPGMFGPIVRHDESCPWLAQLRRDLA